MHTSHTFAETMSNIYFDFKHFRIYHDRCAMKVGTDAVLLGAWAGVEGAHRALDVGCGSGVISLMVAQRAEQVEVRGIDIDAEAVDQARENAEASLFADRVSFCCEDVRKYDSDRKYDCILCNPPFYTEDTLPPDSLRCVARNTSSLPFSDLILNVKRLLAEHGQFHVILPTVAEPQFTALCAKSGLCLKRQCKVKTTIRKSPKRTLCTYSNDICQEAQFEELVLMENGQRTTAFSQLTNDFYLDVPQSS